MVSTRFKSLRRKVNSLDDDGGKGLNIGLGRGSKGFSIWGREVEMDLRLCIAR